MDEQIPPFKTGYPRVEININRSVLQPDCFAGQNFEFAEPVRTVYVCNTRPTLTEKECRDGLKPYVKCYELPVEALNQLGITPPQPHPKPQCDDGIIPAGKPAYGPCAKKPACVPEGLPVVIPDASCYLKTTHPHTPKPICRQPPPQPGCVYDQCQDKAFIYCANQPSNKVIQCTNYIPSTSSHHRCPSNESTQVQCSSHHPSRTRIIKVQESRCEVCPPRCEQVRLKEDVPVYCCKNTPGLVRILEEKVHVSNPRDGPVPKFLPSYEKERCHNMNNIMNWGYSRQWFKERDCVKHMVYPFECEAPATVRLFDGLKCNEW